MAQDIKSRLLTRGFSFNFRRARAKTLRVEQGKPDYWLMAIIAMLLVLGLVMVYSSSFVTAEFNSGNPAYYLWRHLLWLVIGSIGATITALIDYHKFRRFSTWGMIAVMSLLLAVLVLPSSMAPSRFGAKRWISPLGSESDFSFQPSEAAKMMLILYAAHWLSSKGDKVRNFYYGMVPFALTIGAMIALIMGEPDLGTSLVVGCIGLGMFFIAGANVVHMLAAMGIAVAAFFVLATTASYRLARLAAYSDPFADTTGVSWHTVGNLLALGQGGLFGTGLGASRQKFLWLPNVFTDSIFAVIGEELGLVGAGLVVFLFVGLGWRGMRIAAHAPDGFGRLIAAGVTISVVCQALINIAVIASLIPFTGIPLPLMSYGGTSLAVSMTALGFLINISRHQVSDPRLLLAEERRQEERQRRELLREQRQADRDRQEAQLKLLEAEQIEHDRSAGAARHHNSLSSVEYWQERARQRLERHHHGTEQAAQLAAPEIELPGLPAPVQADKVAEIVALPSVATESFLRFQSSAAKAPEGEVEAETGKLALRKPRRDWAKAYEQRRSRK